MNSEQVSLESFCISFKMYLLDFIPDNEKGLHGTALCTGVQGLGLSHPY